MALPYQVQNLVSEQADGNILLSWQGVLGALEYNVQRSIDGVNFSDYASSGVNIQYLDQKPGAGLMYYYQVAAVNATGTGAYSAVTQMVAAPQSEMSLFELRLRSQQTADRVNSNFVVNSEWNSFLRIAMYELYDLLITSYEDYNIAPFLYINTNGSVSGYPMPNGVSNDISYSNTATSIQIKTANFATITDYTYNTSLISVSSNQAQLVAVANPGTFSQAYASSLGFTFNAAFTAIAAGLSQIDTRPVSENFYAHLNSIGTANWSSASTTGTLGGTTSFSNGKLNIGNNGYIQWASTDGVQIGAFRFRVTPAYSGIPASAQLFFAVGVTGFLASRIELYQSSAGNLTLVVVDNVGAYIINVNLGAWAPVSGTEYEFELNYDLTAGATRLFINGVQFGATQVAIGTRAVSNLMGSGIDSGTYVSNYAIRYIQVFTAVQHTANYASPIVPPQDFIFNADIITLPIFSGIYATIQALTSASITDTNSPGYTINNQYWNGSAWVASNSTYGQSNSAAQVITNIATFPVPVGPSGTISVIVITNNNNVSAMKAALFSLNYNASAYSVTNPTIGLFPGLAIIDSNLNQITNISAAVTATGANAITFVVSLNGGTSFLWWDGFAWNGSTTFAQSNSLSTINLHLNSLPVMSNFELLAYLHSATGTTTPTLANVVITYSLLAAQAFYKLVSVDLGVNTSNNAWVTINRFNWIDRNNYVYPNSTSTIYGVYNMRYRLMGNNLVLIPTPAGNQQLRITYQPRLPALLQDTDLTNIGWSGWLRYPIVRAAKYALEKEEGSDTGKLDQELMFLKTRIEQTAVNRDVGQADTISMTRKDPAYGGTGWGGGGGNGAGW